MTSGGTDRSHPSDLELAAWVDEPESGSPATRGHVGSCGRCRERIAQIEAIRAALALDPPMPANAAFDAQRERILAAIASAAPVTGGAHSIGRAAWIVPLAAAAAIGAVILLGDFRAPGEGDVGETDPLLGPAAIDRRAIRPLPPVLAEAREAAESVPVEAMDEDALDAALAAAEPLAPPISVERTATLESEFAALADEEQSAVLVELAGADFDL